MALKVLLLRSRLAPLQTELQTLENTRDGFAAREAELEHDIAEAQTDEERSVVESAVEAFEQEETDGVATAEVPAPAAPAAQPTASAASQSQGEAVDDLPF